MPPKKPPILVGLQHDDFHFELAKEVIDQLAQHHVRTLALESDSWTPTQISIIERVRDEPATTPEAREQFNHALIALRNEPPVSFFRKLSEYAESKGMRAHNIDSPAAINIINTHFWRHMRELMNAGRKLDCSNTTNLVKDVQPVKDQFYSRPEMYFLMANVRNRKMLIRTRNPPQAIIVGAAHAFALAHKLGVAFREVMWAIDQHFVWKPTKPHEIRKLREFVEMKMREEKQTKQLQRKRFEVKKRPRRPRH